jgi:hypothetical protein
MRPRLRACAVSALLSRSLDALVLTAVLSLCTDLCLFDQEQVTGYSGGGNVPSTSVYTSCRTSSAGSSTLAQVRLHTAASHMLSSSLFQSVSYQCNRLHLCV